MARNFAIATDVLTSPVGINIGNSISFWLKTTTTTTNAEVCSKHSATSRTGWGFILNNTAGKLLFVGYASSAQTVSMVSTTTVNDGQWHHVCAQWGYIAGSPAQLWIDGVLQVAVTGGALWGGTALPLRVGKSNDSFWGLAVFDMAELAMWDVQPTSSLNLSDGDVAALAKGASPLLVRSNRLVAYLPLSRDTLDILGAKGVGGPTLTGTTLVEHPRIFPG